MSPNQNHSSKYQHEIAHGLTLPLTDLTRILRNALRAEGESIPDKFTVEPVMEIDAKDSSGETKRMVGLRVKWLGGTSLG